MHRTIQNMLSRHLTEIKTVDGEKHVFLNEDKIDLFEYFDQSLIPVWKPKQLEIPYEQTTQINFDIETTGLNPRVDQIKMIGLINEKGNHYIIDWRKSETEQLLILFKMFEDKKPFWLNHFNGFSFDLPFIQKRCEILGIKYPLWVSPTQTVNATAQKFGDPQKYFAHWFNGGKTHIIDLYHQTLRWDFVARKLTAHNLKVVPVQLGLRTVDRVEMSYKEMLQVYESGDLSIMEQYLIDDLTDTKLLADFFNPAIYYELQYLPTWKVQTLSSSGNGTKWNDMLIRAYAGDEAVTALKKGYEVENIPKVSPKLKFQGALTGATAGFYQCVSKFDVAGLYPSIMMAYGITSEKDYNYQLLARLKYGVDFRAVLKGKKANGTITKQEKQQEGTVKVMNNSAYGMLGVTGKEFNDSVAAALVTGYGRAIFKLMKKLAVEFGGRVVSADTDGLFIEHEKGEGQALFDYVQDRLPRGFTITYEVREKSMFVPPANSKTHDFVDDDQTGKRKNYLIFDETGKLELVKGIYRKRDRCQLEKTFQIDLIRTYIIGGLEPAKILYDEMLKAIRNGKLNTQAITISRKARANEKEVHERNLVDEDGICTYYMADGWQQLKTKRKPTYVKANKGSYSVQYYTDLITTQANEFFKFVS